MPRLWKSLGDFVEGHRVTVRYNGRVLMGRVVHPSLLRNEIHSRDEVSILCDEDVGSAFANGHGLIVGALSSAIDHAPGPELILA